MKTLPRSLTAYAVAQAMLLALFIWAALAGTHAALAQGKPSYTVSAAQLQQAVAQRFPMRYQVAGLVDLDVKSPLLRLLPEQNRLAATVAINAAGPALGRSYPGTFDIDFALRYEPSDQTLRAHQLQVRSLRMEGLNPGTTELLQATLPGLVRDNLREVVVHRLRPQDLALPDGMGLQPDTITVTRDGLEIGFAPKR
ncbi:MAG: DUF1439 domain-containing protein [Pseudomonadota bacterium]